MNLLRRNFDNHLELGRWNLELYTSALMKVFYLNLAVSLLLIIGGFFVPPIGIIDGSVLTAVGLLLMFSVVERIPSAIRAGKSVKIQKGDITAEISTKND